MSLDFSLNKIGTEESNSKKQAIQAIENGDITIKDIIGLYDVSDILDEINFDELNGYVRKNRGI